MRSGVTIVAGLLAGVLVAFGILAALVFVGPDPVGLRPTPSPSAEPSLVAVAIDLRVSDVVAREADGVEVDEHRPPP
jgi:hypothetical protein